MVKIYEKYDKLEKPIVKLSDAIKSLLSLSNKDQENIMKGVSYVLGDELDTIEAFISTVKMTRISKDDEYDDVEENVEDEEEDPDQWSDTDEEDIEDDEDELEPPTVGDIVNNDSEADRSFIEPVDLTEKIEVPTELMNKYSRKYLKRAGGKQVRLSLSEVLQWCLLLQKYLKTMGGRAPVLDVYNVIDEYSKNNFDKDIISRYIYDFLSGHSHRRITAEFFHKNSINRTIYLN